MNKSTAKLFVSTFFEPDCDVPAMIKQRTAMYASYLPYTRKRWELISGWRYWGHEKVFNGVVAELKAIGVKFKTKDDRGYRSIYIYSRQSPEVNAIARELLDKRADLPEYYRNVALNNIK